ncbi:malate synthase [Tahibacter aquaticus]|uniref:malate synthase n=1 Tax=Tahibacter aquaticus TaxID=520092 RepID=A0A4R6YSQ9_9GAMM|nr:malate synthase A [Tahibacter aquaticus]TDR41301.1 malate synthase [Tahibacter aquaticus]
MAVPADQFASPAVEIRAVIKPGYEQILTAPALAFLAALHRRFDTRRRHLLDARVARQARFDAGELPDFLPETRAIRESDWTVAPIPVALIDRRVEITGPVERKMIINALNSGAKVFMADFEDSSAPTWEVLLDGQINLRDAVAGTIEYKTADGREYRLKAEQAELVVRPRGWHLPEKHARVDGEEMAGALFDFGLYAFHNAQVLQGRERGPYFYLPKMESHREAALWDEVMAFAETELDLPTGSMKATVLIETLPAVFEMHEILHALQSRVVGLNCGRWDYIFSYIKTFRAHRSHILPERGQVGMTVPFLKAYSELLIQTCHRRGAFAMGGMAAQIPISGDAEANELALARVRADKQREARAGHDGTWVAHPGLIPVAQAEFDAAMPGANQLQQRREDVKVSRDDLVLAPPGTITRSGFLNNIDVCVRYLAAWLDGLGCVPIHHLMEDAATAEISRAQLWHWLHHEGLKLDDGTPLDFALFDQAIHSVAERLPKTGLPGQDRVPQAAWMLAELTHARQLADFLTLPAYALLP